MADRTRTGDRLDHNQELYQLSYSHHAAFQSSEPRLGLGARAVGGSQGGEGLEARCGVLDQVGLCRFRFGRELGGALVAKSSASLAVEQAAIRNLAVSELEIGKLRIKDDGSSRAPTPPPRHVS